MSRFHRALATCCGVALCLAASVSEADMTKEQCVKANTDGQTFRLDGKLAAARAQLDACSDPSCPAMVRRDCLERRNDLDRAQPTIAFDVKDASGGDVSAVRVTVDGHPLADSLDGRGLRVDPGEHTFTFTASGAPPVVRKLVIKEGEKDRIERIDLPPVAPAAKTTTTTTDTGPRSTESPPAPDTGPRDTESPPAPDTGDGMSLGRKLGLVAGGLGIAGIAVGSIFGVMTFSAVKDQNNQCSGPPCTGDSFNRATSDHQDATTDGLVSTVGFIVGGALLAAGVTLFFVSPATTGGSAPTSTGLMILPSAGPGGAGAALRGSF